MGRISRLLSFARSVRSGAKISQAKVEPGGGATVLLDHFAPPGDDSNPLPSDFVAAVTNSQTGGEVAVGYADTVNPKQTTSGEVRRAARSPLTRLEVIWWWLKSDGSAIIDNGNGSIELKSNGDISLNGVIIKPTGDIIAPTKIEVPSVIAAGKELADHTHLSNGQGNQTEPNT